MSTGFIEGSFADANALITKINQQLNQDLPLAQTVYDKISMVDTSNAYGLIAMYPFHVGGSIEAEIGYKNPMKFSEPLIEEITCRVNMFGSNPGLLVPLYNELDPYGVVKRHANDWLRLLPKIPDRRLAKLINANGNWVDGQPFFGTHVVNREVKSGLSTTTFTNDLTVTGSAENWYLTAFDALRSIPGYDGALLNVDMSYVKIVCSSMKLGLKFIKLFNEGINAEQIGGAAASTTTRLVGSGEVIVMPELYDPAVPNSDRQFYMINTDMLKTRPPFVVRIAHQPQIEMTSGGPDDDIARSMSARGVYFKTSQGYAYGLPHKIVRCTVTG